MMSCPKCKHAAVSVYTRVSLYWERKKDPSAWARFEEVMHAYDNWKNPMRDVTDLIGQLEASTGVKYSPRWYDILKETGDKHWTNNCLHVKTCVSDLFNHWFHFIEIGKKDTRVWAWFWWSHACVWQLEEFEERCHWFDRSNGSVDSGQIFASMV